MLIAYTKSMTTTGINCTHVNEWDRGRLICVDCANKARAGTDAAAEVAA